MLKDSFLCISVYLFFYDIFKYGVFETTTENWDKLLEFNEKEDVVKALSAGEDNTSITYNFRNYCGDKIRLALQGLRCNDKKRRRLRNLFSIHVLYAKCIWLYHPLYNRWQPCMGRSQGTSRD